MKPSEVTISGYITIKGEDWIMSVKAEVTAEDYKLLLAETIAMAAKLKKAGFRSYQHETPRASTGTVINGPNEKPSAAFAWPAPVCPDCDVDMKVSKFQKDDGLIYYYCSNQLPMGGYCKQCATVSETSGSPNYYEVKK